MSITSPLLVAMDFSHAADCLALAQQLNPKHCRLKVGKELFTSAGPVLVEQLMQMDFEIFLDLKFHDIPTTCAKAVKASAELGVWMVNVHASGGLSMMVAAREAIDHAQGAKPLLIGVTVLTSMHHDDLRGIGITQRPEEQVLRLAALAKKAALDGVVCSAQEASVLKSTLGQDFCLVSPGIRPAGSANNDQCRIMTPEDALEQGSDYLVIGRPITQAPEPAVACEDILKSIKVL
ncbi:MAG: orotidine-5'-phosphate decarboxylase [Pseudomonadota bacterium]